MPNLNEEATPCMGRFASPPKRSYGTLSRMCFNSNVLTPPLTRLADHALLPNHLGLCHSLQFCSSVYSYVGSGAHCFCSFLVFELPDRCAQTACQEFFLLLCLFLEPDFIFFIYAHEQRNILIFHIKLVSPVIIKKIIVHCTCML